MFAGGRRKKLNTQLAECTPAAVVMLAAFMITVTTAVPGSGVAYVDTTVPLSVHAGRL